MAAERPPSFDVRSDPELLRAVRAGDADAWAELWLRHHEAAERAAGALTPDRAEAEDAVADTFGAVHRALMSGHGPDVHFRAYLLTAVRRAVADRRLGPVPVAADDLPVVVWLDEPAEDGPSERAVAVEAFAALPERYRTVLWHAEVEQEPLADVGRTLGLSASAVAQLLVRARRQLRRTYVQRHLDHARRADLPAACQEIQDLLGAYVIAALAERDRTRVEAHLDDCEDCDRVLAFAGEVGAGLRACLLPGLLGSAAGARYLAGTGVAHHGAVVGAAAAAPSPAGAASSGGAGVGAGPRVPGKGAMGAMAAAIVAVMMAGGIGLAAQAADSSHSPPQPQASTHLVTPSVHQEAASSPDGGARAGSPSLSPAPTGRTGVPPSVAGSSTSASSSSSAPTSSVTTAPPVAAPAASGTSPVRGSMAAAAATPPTTTYVPSSAMTTTRPPSSSGSTTTTPTMVPPPTTTTVPETTTTTAPASTTTTTCDQQEATIVVCLTLP